MFALCACVSGADVPSIVGHVDGECNVHVRLTIIDAHGAPVPDVRVSFYDRFQEAARQQRELELKHDGTSSVGLQVPIERVTSKDGSLTIECRFAAAFVQGVVKGKIAVVATDIFPSGAFVFGHPSIGTGEFSAREIIGLSKCTPEEADLPIVLKRKSQDVPGFEILRQTPSKFRFEMPRLPSRPNQSMEPTATAVTHPADAGCAPAVAVAHH